MINDSEKLAKKIIDDVSRILHATSIEEITKLEIDIKSALGEIVEKHPNKYEEIFRAFLAERSSFHCVLIYQRGVILNKDSGYDKSNLYYDINLMGLALLFDH